MVVRIAEVADLVHIVITEIVAMPDSTPEFASKSSHAGHADGRQCTLLSTSVADGAAETRLLAIALVGVDVITGAAIRSTNFGIITRYLRHRVPGSGKIITMANGGYISPIIAGETMKL
jgi:hypothetical protein